MTKVSLIPRLFTGKMETASYNEQSIDEYRDNPLIEALPPIFSKVEFVSKMKEYPEIREEERGLEPHIRFHLVQRLESLIHPLSPHIDLEQRISRMIRRGYLSRNAATPQHARKLRDIAMQSLNPEIAKLEAEKFKVPLPSSKGFTIIGVSGVGKTTSVEKILSMYPQVIIHNEYQGKEFFHHQVVWMKLDCPFDGSIKGLCLNFFQAIDELFGTNNYMKYGERTTDQLILNMKQVAASLSLGVLVIDEIQHLNEAKSGGAAKMLNFFVQLVNIIGLPVVLIGTFKAKALLGNEFRNGRRGTGQGSIEWERMGKNNEWDSLLNRMWRYQWTKKFTPITNELNDVMYEESQGITDLTIKLFMLAQWRAIASGVEEITVPLIQSVAKDNFKIIRPALDALKSGNKKKLMQHPDIFSEIDMEVSLSDANRELNQRIIMQVLEEQEQQNDENEIIDWLLVAGFNLDIAKMAVEQTKVDDVTQWRVLSFQKASLLQKDSLSKQKSPQRKKDRPNKEQTPLLQLVEEGSKNKEISYEALRRGGYILDVTHTLGLG